MDCDVIKDLMPMYMEKLTSEASNKIVNEHILECEECMSALEEMKQELVISSNSELAVDEVNTLVNKLIYNIKRNLYQKLTMVGLIALFIGVLAGIASSNARFYFGFIGTLSLLYFVIAIAVSLPISSRRKSIKKQFSTLWQLTFVFTALVSILFVLLPAGIGNFNHIIILLELIYNLIFSITLSLYSRIKIPKTEDHISLSYKKPFKIAVIALICITITIALPVTLFEACKTVDNINKPFVSDPEVIGKWDTIDLIKNKNAFTANPTEKHELYLKRITFMENGKINMSFPNDKVTEKDDNTPGLTWTKGYLSDRNEKTASKYEIIKVNGRNYMLFEWKTSDYTYFHRKPVYYVLEKD